jgi:hypothetical protein
VTLGLVLAIEEPEQGLMDKPPRRAGKPLVGKAILWRSVFVGTAMIVAMLGNAEWESSLGGSRRQSFTVAMNTLVVSQCLYCLSCRFAHASSLHLNAVVTNPWLTAMVLLNAALQCLLTYAPGVQDVFETEAISGLAWLRVVGLAAAIFLLVEAEKVVGPRYVRPLVMPAIRALARVVSPERDPGHLAARREAATAAAAAAASSGGASAAPNDVASSPPGAGDASAAAASVDVSVDVK